MKKEGNIVKRAYQATMSALKKAWRWIKRSFSVGKGELAEVDGVKIESPSKLIAKAFFRRKSALFALSLLLGLFLFVFIAPTIVRLDKNYTDPLQQNAPPSYSLRAVPKGLKKDIAEINGFADFTVGISRKGKLYVWGNTKDRLQKRDLKTLPKQVKAEGVLAAAAGKDHIIAVTKSGEIVGWGDKSCGQYGYEKVLNALAMPEILREGVGKIGVKALSCGYQATALVLQDGRAYVWGNLNAVRNLSSFENATDMEKIVFTNSLAVGLTTDGALRTETGFFSSVIGSKNGRGRDLNAYLGGRKVKILASSNKCVALVTEDHELVLSGAFENGEDELPTLEDGEYFVDIDGGSRHFVGVTNFGNTYAWGHNAYGQCNVKKSGDRVFAGSLQSYVAEEGKLRQSVGLKGYLMGTDGRGRDIFARIAHGGKMTMTIGGVAVIVSSTIAILVGCTAGYFGGFVDTLLMRITEIFSSIPFLPFAMLLSQIIKNYSVSETTRILIIMLILGALSWTGLARMIRGQVLAEREKEFVLSARAMGVKEGKIAFRHVLPNVVSVILVSMTLDFAGCLLTESSLSYLGFGVQQPRPTWGNMLTGCNNSTVIQHYWWQWLFPALFLSAAVICINVIGDALRDALDPKKGGRV